MSQAPEQRQLWLPGGGADRPLSRRAQFWFMLLLTAAATLLLGLVLSPMAGALFSAIVFAIVLQPVQAWLARRCRGHQTLAAGILTTGLVLLVVVPVGLLGYALVQQVDKGLNALQADVDARGVDAVLEPVPKPLRGRARELLLLLAPPSKLGAHAQDGEQEPATAAGQGGSDSTVGRGLAAAPDIAAAILGWLGAFSFDVVVFVVGLLFLLAGGTNLLDWMLQAMPLQRRDAEALLFELGETTRGVFLATVLTALVQTLVALGGYLIAGTPYVLLITTATFVIALVPILGGAFASFAVGLVTLLAGDTGNGILLMIWSVVLVNLTENVLRPVFAEGRVRLPASIIFFAMLGGIAVFGTMGIIAGPLIVVFFRTVLRLLRRRLEALQPVADGGTSLAPATPAPEGAGG